MQPYFTQHIDLTLNIELKKLRENGLIDSKMWSYMTRSLI